MSALSAASKPNIWYTYSIFIMFNMVFFTIIVHHIYQKLIQYQSFCHKFSAFRAWCVSKAGKQNISTDVELEDKEKAAPYTLSTVPTTTVSFDEIPLREPQLEESSF